MFTAGPQPQARPAPHPAGTASVASACPVYKLTPARTPGHDGAEPPIFPELSAWPLEGARSYLGLQSGEEEGWT